MTGGRGKDFGLFNHDVVKSRSKAWKTAIRDVVLVDVREGGIRERLGLRFGLLSEVGRAQVVEMGGALQYSISAKASQP